MSPSYPFRSFNATISLTERLKNKASNNLFLGDLKKEAQRKHQTLVPKISIGRSLILIIQPNPDFSSRPSCCDGGLRCHILKFLWGTVNYLLEKSGADRRDDPTDHKQSAQPKVMRESVTQHAFVKIGNRILSIRSINVKTKKFLHQTCGQIKFFNNKEMPMLPSTIMPNELFDYWMRKLSPAEFKVLMCIARKAFDNDKEFVGISLSQIEESTGLSRRGITKNINVLVSYGLIKKITSKSVGFVRGQNKYAIKVKKGWDNHSQPSRMNTNHNYGDNHD